MNTPYARNAYEAPTSKTATALGIVAGTLLTAVMVKVAYNNIKAIISDSAPSTDKPQDLPVQISEEV